MLRTVIVYRAGGREVPVLESRDPDTARKVFLLLRDEYIAAAAACSDPVLREVILGELAQAESALRAAGLARIDALDALAGEGQP